MIIWNMEKSGARHNTVSFSRELLKRPRIEMMLGQGLKSALCTVVAGPGYGKTHEAASFLSTANVRLAWVHLTNLDNLPAHFWSKFIHALTPEFPISAKKLNEIGFPDSLAKIDAMMRILSKEIYAGSLAVLVMDRYGILKNPDILNLMEHIVESAMENSCMILLTDQPTELDLVSIRSGGGVAHLTTKDLKFTQDEVREYFALQSLELQPQQLGEIYRYTDGWPLAVYLICQQQQQPDPPPVSSSVNLPMIQLIFEREYYDTYDIPTQQLLQQLSLMSEFPPSMIDILGGADSPAFHKTLKSNNFMQYNQSSNMYCFQNMYHEFLLEKASTMDENDKKRVFSLAAAHAEQLGLPMEAIDFYSKSGQYDEMLNIMVRFFGRRFSIDLQQATFFMERLSAIPPGTVKDIDLRDYLMVDLYIQSLQTDNALTLLDEMERRLTQQDTPNARKMLGEVYERRAGIAMMYRQENFMDYYKTAYSYLGGSSRLKHKSMIRYKNFSILSIPSEKPGALDRFIKKIHDNNKYMVAVENNNANGFEYLFSTEAAYHRYDLALMEQMAQRAEMEAKSTGQHDILCNTYYFQAKAAYLQGDFNNTLRYIEAIHNYIEDIQLPEMNDVADFAYSWFYLKMGDTEKMAPWTTGADSGLAAKVPLAIGREELLCAMYLLEKREYVRLIALLEQIKDWYMSKGWAENLGSNILLSIAHSRLDNMDKSMEYFMTAYNMTYANGLITAFVESERDMMVLLGKLQQHQPGSIDPAWADRVLARCVEVSKRKSSMQKQYQEHSATHEVDNTNFNDQERHLLLHISQGLTREEIADRYNTTISTIKDMMRGVYSKLGAINRGDAVRIAIARGIIH